MIKEKVRHLLKENKGFTLVELLVSFTLLLILMTSATTIISPSSKVFLKAVGAGRAQNVSTILMDRMMNELGSAAEIVEVKETKIEYIDDGGNNVVMDKKVVGGAENEYSILQLTYQKSDGDELKWNYPEKMYMGNTIEELKFSEVADRDDLIEVKLKIKNVQTGYEYERTRIVKCYALDDEK